MEKVFQEVWLHRKKELLEEGKYILKEIEIEGSCGQWAVKSIQREDLPNINSWADQEDWLPNTDGRRIGWQERNLV